MTEGNEVKIREWEKRRENETKKVLTMNIKLIFQVKLFFQFLKSKILKDT